MKPFEAVARLGTELRLPWARPLPRRIGRRAVLRKQPFSGWHSISRMVCRARILSQNSAVNAKTNVKLWRCGDSIHSSGVFFGRKHHIGKVKHNLQRPVPVAVARYTNVSDCSRYITRVPYRRSHRVSHAPLFDEDRLPCPANRDVPYS